MLKYLCLSKDNVGVRYRVLEDVRLVDNEEDVLRFPDGNSADSLNLKGKECGEEPQNTDVVSQNQHT